MDFLSVEKLDEVTCNKIKAGQLYLQPSNIIREFVDNSIDSGCDEIVVEMVNNGYDEICVHDNGTGILFSEATKICKRHWSSKSYKDGTSDTLGYRGEALACVSSIANVRIQSRHRQDETGWSCIYNENTDVPTPTVSHREYGTTITVTDLYSTYDVRRNLSKAKMKIELTNIITLIHEYSILYCSIHWRLFDSGNNNRLLDIGPDKDFTARLKFMYPGLRNVQNQLDQADYSWGCVKKLIRDGSIVDRVIIVVNGSIRIWPKLHRAICSLYEGYQSRSSSSKIFIFLELDISMELIDKNVESSKRKLIISDENIVISDVINLINRVHSRCMDDNNATKTGSSSNAGTSTSHAPLNSISIISSQTSLHSYPAAIKKRLNNSIATEFENKTDSNMGYMELDMKLLENENIILSEFEFVGTCDLMEYFLGHKEAIVSIRLGDIMRDVVLKLCDSIALPLRIDMRDILGDMQHDCPWFSIENGLVTRIPVLYYESNCKEFAISVSKLSNTFTDQDVVVEYVRTLHSIDAKRGLGIILWDAIAQSIFNDPDYTLNYKMSPKLKDILSAFERC